MKVYSLTVRNRALAALIGLAVLAAGAALLVIGIALLVGLAMAAGALGLGIIAWRKLRGRPARGRPAPGLPPDAPRAADRLDPSLEIFPEPRALPPRPYAGPNDAR